MHCVCAHAHPRTHARTHARRYYSARNISGVPPPAYDPRPEDERGRVKLTAACSVEQQEEESDLGFMFRLNCPGHPKNPFTFLAKERDDFDEWVRRLKGCIGEAQVLLSPTIRTRVGAGGRRFSVLDDALLPDALDDQQRPPDGLDLSLIHI